MGSREAVGLGVRTFESGWDGGVGIPGLEAAIPAPRVPNADVVAPNPTAGALAAAGAPKAAGAAVVAAPKPLNPNAEVEAGVDAAPNRELPEACSSAQPPAVRSSHQQQGSTRTSGRRAAAGSSGLEPTPNERPRPISRAYAMPHSPLFADVPRALRRSR